tara:strand:+ start:206 stop:646 length:441 start_codon:yes stop_codon:yes gene_type:complete
MFRIYIIAGLAMAVLGLGWGLKTSLEKNAVLESKYEAQQAETQKAINQINALKIDHATQIARSTEYFNQAREKNTALKKEIINVRNTSDSLKAALLREPTRTGRVTTILDARSLREICRASGGTKTDCKISLPKPPASKPRDSAKK